MSYSNMLFIKITFLKKIKTLSVSRREYHPLSDGCSEMESEVAHSRAPSCQSNDNSETGSNFGYDSFHNSSGILKGQDPACSSPHR